MTAPPSERALASQEATSDSDLGARVQLCSSLFYFRLPQQEWERRIAHVAASGYTLVDVYIPWNFHEQAPGELDFTGRRDVGAFLDLVYDAGLGAIVRPGPYICSEWDGGALPAWLTLDPDLRLRQNEPRYLRAALAWYDAVLPIVASRQVDAAAPGPVVAVQIENELDFFDTADRTGYLTALARSARGHGITVPLIACAGQGDLAGATGGLDGVLPALNFYPDDSSPAIEPEVRRYADVLAQRGRPLLVTETNRVHRTLRRLIASGARLVAPYLQASGWNFGLTPSVGNWGDPGGFMTHSYDFGGYVSDDGRVRPELVEAAVLARVVAAFDGLPGSRPVAWPGALTTSFTTASSPSMLALDGGGTVEVPVAAGACPLLAIDVAVPGAGARLLLGGRDVVGLVGGVQIASDVTVPVLISDGDGVTRLDLGPGESGSACGVSVQVRRRADVAGMTPDPEPGTPRALTTGRLLPHVDLYDGAAAHASDAPPTLESLGTYRGRGRYEAALPPGAGVVLIAGAADIVQVRAGEDVAPTIASFGAAELVEVGAADSIEIDVEIWGHANFDDARLPALLAGSLRGVGSVWAVTASDDESALWRVRGHWADRDVEPLRVLGTWSSTRLREPIAYLRSFPAGAVVLAGLDRPIRYAVGGGPERVLHPADPVVLMPEPGELRIVLEHDPSAPTPSARWYGLEPVRGWVVRTHDDRALRRLAAEPREDATPAGLPVTLDPGEIAWLDLVLPPSPTGLRLRFPGEQVRVTGWFAGECLGRVWLTDPARPPFTGGDPDSLWLPGAWAAQGGRLSLMLQGTAGPGSPRLDAVETTELR